jgi:hypothetical protein
MDYSLSAINLILRQPGGLDEEELDRHPCIIPNIMPLLRLQPEGVSFGHPVLLAFHDHQRTPLQKEEGLLYLRMIMGAQGLAGEKPNQPPFIERTAEQILGTRISLPKGHILFMDSLHKLPPHLP